MKTLKTLAAVLLIAISSTAFANDETSNYKLKMDYTLQTYVDAVWHGELTGLNEILDKDVKFTFTRNEKIFNYGKNDLLKFFKSIENIEQNCVTETSIIEADSTQTIVKVEMKYKNFTRVNYLSLANTAKGWKVTNITSTFI